MYLEAEKRTYNSDCYTEEQKERDEVKTNEKIREMFPEMFKTNNLNYINIAFEVGYWRKANHIHKWFVDNVQNGIDDCKRYFVEREELKELLEICKQVLKETELIEGKVQNGYKIDKDGKQVPILEDGKTVKDSSVAESLLPVQSGFFFGNEEYNEWYINDIKDTIDIIDKCLKLPENWYFYYRSSW